MDDNLKFEDYCILKDEEKSIFQQFKEKMKDWDQDDVTLLRFLRARDYNLNKAAEMLIKTINWRKTNKVDECLTWDISDEVKKGFAFGCEARDFDGKAVIRIPCGRWEVRKMIGFGWSEEMKRYIFVVMESCMAALKTTPYQRLSVVVDLAELTYYKVAHYETMQMVLCVCRYFEENYPERLHRIVVINAPWVLNYIFPLLKPLITGKTFPKIEIYDSNPEKFMPILEKMVPQSQLKYLIDVDENEKHQRQEEIN